MNAELTFLQFLQSLHSPMLDGSMCFITRLGDSGILWVTLTAVLLVFRKTRRVGCVLAAALLIDAVLCNLLLKPLVARVRPCGILTEVQLLIPYPDDFSFPSGPYSGVLRLGDSPLDGREKAVGDGGSAGRRSHRILADVPLCPLPDGYSGWCHFGSCLWMGGSMARKESRAPNGHPAELKKEEETAVHFLSMDRIKSRSSSFSIFSRLISYACSATMSWMSIFPWPAFWMQLDTCRQLSLLSIEPKYPVSDALPVYS